MAEAVAEAIAEPHHLMVEAGTGVGKSFAYLVPAIQAAVAKEDCVVIVSTHTISLQEQLVQKDIPFLQKVMPRPVCRVLARSCPTGRSGCVTSPTTGCGPFRSAKNVGSANVPEPIMIKRMIVNDE